MVRVQSVQPWGGRRARRIISLLRVLRLRGASRSPPSEPFGDLGTVRVQGAKQSGRGWGFGPG
ncbi:hypothetical protein AMR42_07260 [Limnothrix sp. PR1529]|uniref:hypothetical protein n=1 Tax=Limnothrix sp. PR1529 TaxID=1704291 RepID=UPI00081E5C2D|nr:hypothetical protein [Limnothrix sp. PR1529]OCQ91838.1 hypothetical protein BCR12_01695 [Limnothrix sp. P13C2]PIB14125.1 hypothetical protein AMR42_07260 [Limnothrix sp. PR1529]